MKYTWVEEDLFIINNSIQILFRVKDKQLSKQQDSICKLIKAGQLERVNEGSFPYENPWMEIYWREG